MEVDEENNFFVRYYFSTNPISVQLHEFCGDGGFVVIPDDKTELVNGNRIVRIGIGKNKWTDVRGMKADVIADLIPKKKDIRISFDAQTRNSHKRTGDLVYNGDGNGQSRGCPSGQKSESGESDRI